MGKLKMIDGATKDDKSRWNYHYNEYEKYKKYRTKLNIFTYGFYIGMTLWMCGMVTSMIVENFGGQNSFDIYTISYLSFLYNR